MANRIEIIISAIDQTSQVVSSIGSNLQSFGSKLSGVGRSLLPLTAAITGGVAALGKLGSDASTFDGVQGAFEGIATNADSMMESLQTAAGGLVTNRALMTSFNKAAQLVSVDFAETLPDAMGALNKVALATGQDVGFLLDSLVTGVGRLSPLILDNLGITVDTTAAYAEYADQVGKSTKELTEQEKQVALTNQVMELLAENTEDMPDATNTFASMTVALTNMKDEIAVALLPALLPLVQNISDIVVQHGPGLVAIVAQAADSFSNMSPAMQRGAMVLAAVAAAAGPVLIVLGSLISAAGTVASAAGAMGAILSGPTVAGALASIAAVLTGPVLLAIAAVVAAIAGLAYAWQNNLLNIREFFASFESLFKGDLGQFTADIAAWFDSVDWGQIGYNMAQAIVGGLKQLYEWDRELRAWMAGLVPQFIEAVSEVDWSQVGLAILHAIGASVNFNNMIKDRVTGAFMDFGSGVLSGAGDALGIGGGQGQVTNNNGSSVSLVYNDYSGNGAQNAAALTQSYETAYGTSHRR